jgi:hypothetical protein
MVVWLGIDESRALRRVANPTRPRSFGATNAARCRSGWPCQCALGERVAHTQSAGGEAHQALGDDGRG